MLHPNLNPPLLSVLLALPFVGLRTYGDYAAAIRTVTWYGNSWNASYASFMTRILGGSGDTPLVEAPAVARGLMLLASGATICWLLWFTRPRCVDPYSLIRFDLGFGLALTSMLLVSPLGWMYYFPLLMLPAYRAWTLTRGKSMRSIRCGLVLDWGLTTVPMSMVGAAGVNDPLGWFTSNSVYFYALFILTAVVSLALTRVHSGSDSASAS